MSIEVSSQNFTWKLWQGHLNASSTFSRIYCRDLTQVGEITEFRSDLALILAKRKNPTISLTIILITTSILISYLTVLNRSFAFFGSQAIQKKTTRNQVSYCESLKLNGIMVQLAKLNRVCLEYLWLFIYHQVTLPQVYFSKIRGNYELLLDFFSVKRSAPWILSVCPTPDIYSWTTCSQNCLNSRVLSAILPFSDQKGDSCHLSCSLWLSQLSPYCFLASSTWEGEARNREHS